MWIKAGHNVMDLVFVWSYQLRTLNNMLRSLQNLWGMRL